MLKNRQQTMSVRGKQNLGHLVRCSFQHENHIEFMGSLSLNCYKVGLEQDPSESKCSKTDVLKKN